MTTRFTPDLMRGTLDLMVLGVLADGPQYGYSIQQRLREASRGQVNAQAGTLYPLLHRLEQEGLIRARWDDDSGRRRKWYELTRSGRAQLKRQAQQWHEYAACVRRLLDGVTGLSGMASAAGKPAG